MKAPPGMVHCVKIMNMLRGIHTTVLSSLEGIAVQMEWFRENWYEEVRLLRTTQRTHCQAGRHVLFNVLLLMIFLTIFILKEKMWFLCII